MPATSQSQRLAHLGLVAAMFDALGIGAVIDQAMAQGTSKRPVSVGQAVKAMVLNGLGGVTPHLYRVPTFFDNKPPDRLIGPAGEAAPLNDEVLGRALAPLDDVGVTPLYTLMASEAEEPPRYLVAESALYSAANPGKFAQGAVQWITRVPATLQAVPEHLAHPEVEARAGRTDGDRSREVASGCGGVEQRWFLIYSAARPRRLEAPVDTQRARHSDHARQAVKQRCAKTFAGAADARQALVAQKSGVVLATNAREAQALEASEVWAAYKAQSGAERGCRFLKSPEFLAAALSLKQPERLMALLMVMTVCWLGYAALESRLRQALREQDETFPAQQGRPTQPPTARWGFHGFVGMHVVLGATDKPH